MHAKAKIEPDYDANWYTNGFDANKYDNLLCQIFDQYCDIEPTRTHCKCCGKRICPNCSLRTRKWLSGNRWKICHICLRKGGLDDVVDDHLDDLSELYGYDYRDSFEPVKNLHLTKEDVI